MNCTACDQHPDRSDRGLIKGRVLIYATTAYMIERFNMMNISMLQDMGYEVDAACNFEYGNPMSEESIREFRQRLERMNVRCYQLPLTRKITDIRHNGAALKESIRIMRENNYSFVHCHTPVGSVIARIACRLTGTRVIYTAHGFHFFDGAPRKNWLMYYPVEKLFSYVTDVLITINREDCERAARHFGMKRLEYVPGIGIDMHRFKAAAEQQDADRKMLRAELGADDDTLLIISAGELSKRKNHISALRAFAKIDQMTARPSRRYMYVIAGTGIYADELQGFIDRHGLGERIKLLGYREDIARLYRAADAFLFPSYQEGLSAALMEAMASGLPACVSRIRGNTELIDEQGGLLFDVGQEPGEVDFNDDEALASETLDKCSSGRSDIFQAVLRLLMLSGDELRSMGRHNHDRIRDGFSKETVAKRLREIYESMR